MHERSLPASDDGPVVGRLEGISIPDLMWALCSRSKTGVLSLVRGAVTKRVYIQDGRIVFAASSDPNDRLGEMLLREGLVTLDQIEGAASMLCPGKRLGTVLVEMGYLPPGDLVRGVVGQVRDIVLGLFGWDEGEYRFDDGPLPSEEVITLGMRTAEILLQGIRRIRSFSRIRRSVGAPAMRYCLADGWWERLEGLSLGEGEKILLQRLEGAGSTIERLCREVFLSNFEIYQALWAFKVLGAIQESERAPEMQGDFVVEGTLGSQGLMEKLVRLCRAGETGVLHVSRGASERTFHIREGRCVFATSNNIDDGLIAHLLRRGVISLSDREETAKRLLSNKRVGTILLEMGVIDANDLREMVREQLSEIVYDTFRWEEGEYAFVAGELPTIEEIVLESDLEDLVAEGVRRLASWTRVREGCGGVDAHLALASGYLEILDRMRVGADEWAVVSALRSPRRVLDVCRETRIGDFRACQILWTLRLLGAAEWQPAAADAVVLPAAITETWPVRAPAAEAEAPGPQADAGEAVVPGPEEPMLDSAAAATLVLSREEVEAAIGIAPSVEGPQGFEIAPPGTGVAEFDEIAGVVEEALVAGLEVESEPAPGRESASSEFAGEPSMGDEASGAVFEVESEPAPGRESASSEFAGEPSMGDEASGAVFEVESEPAPGTEPASSEFADEPCMGDEAPGAMFEVESEPAPAGEPAHGEPAEEPCIADEVPGAAFEVESEPAPAGEPAHDEPAGEPCVGDEAQGTVLDAESLPAPANEQAVTASAEEPCMGDEAPAADVEAAPECAPAPEPPLPRGAEEPASFDDNRAEAEGQAAREAADTAAISKEEVETALREVTATRAALAAAPESLESVSSEAGGDAWAPPAELDEHIARFNARHRLVFRAIRAAIGAGAANLVRACGGRVSQGCDGLFAAGCLLPDGTWDSSALRRAVVDHEIREPWVGFERLLESEIEVLRTEAGDARASALKEQILQL